MAFYGDLLSLRVSEMQLTWNKEQRKKLNWGEFQFRPCQLFRKYDFSIHRFSNVRIGNELYVKIEKWSNYQKVLILFLKQNFRKWNGFNTSFLAAFIEPEKLEIKNNGLLRCVGLFRGYGNPIYLKHREGG